MRLNILFLKKTRLHGWLFKPAQLRDLNYFSLLMGISLILMSEPLLAQTFKDRLIAQDLKKMSIEELMQLEVTSVSKRPEKLTEVASAIQVITKEDIRRSAATNLPEALRLTANLQVAQLNSSAHIISARGFNALFSNKLLVLIDGRTVYSPLFAGVFWDAQQVVLEDVERIEIISGPGGTFWGANAVNGVINIITKSAGETHGLLVSGAAGSYLRKSGTLRYGGKIGNSLSYRVYAQHNNRDHTFLPDGTEGMDRWGISNGGFRMDWNPSEANSLTFQGNAYKGKEETAPLPSTLDGQNILGRWTHTFSVNSVLKVQGYIDRTWRRDIPSTISDELKTYDIEIQHHFNISKRNLFIWGGGYRFMDNHTMNSTRFFGILPNKRNMSLFNVFVQDEIRLLPEVKLRIGTKVQHGFFTGIEIQPSTRMLWTPRNNEILWGAVSRAVRTPSRVDVDYFIPTYPVPPEDPSVAGGPNFVSEKVMAYELGYRVRPSANLSLSFASFYNRYDDLYSVEALPGTLTYQIQNGTEGRSWGAELSGTWQVSENWRLRGGYTYFDKDLQNKPGRIYDFSSLGNDAKHQGLLHSIANLPGNFQFDTSMRYLGQLSGKSIRDYFTIDARLAWTFKAWGVFSIVGQNLWQEKHKEFQNQIPRSLYGKFICSF